MKQSIIKMTILVTMGLVFSGNVLAQQSRLEIGIEAGHSARWISGSDFVEQTRTMGLGFSSGLTFQYNLNKYLSLRSGLGFERKGCISDMKMTDAQGNSLGTVRVNDNFDYVTLPVLARVSFGNRVRFFANAGPYMAYLASRKAVYRGLPGSEDSRIVDEMPYFLNADFGVSAGLGLTVPIRESFIFSFEARSNTGLYNISSRPIYGGGTIQTNSFNMLFGLAYRIGSGNE